MELKNIYLLLLILTILIITSCGQIDISETMKVTTIKIEGQRFKTVKGRIKVKLDHADSSSRFIDLPVCIIKSPNKNAQEPIFWLAGGPGISNMKQKPAKNLLENHDFVLAGYRGVDGTVSLKSKQISKAVKGINNSLLSNESLKNIENSVNLYIKELTVRGINLNNFTILDVIEDFEEIRNQLGYKKINLLSTSYGTRVALLYSYKYPNVINKSVMVGVNPPGHFFWWPDKTEEIIKEYDKKYQNYILNKNQSIEKNISIAFLKMPKRWTFFKLDADKIKAATFVLLYRKQSAVMVFDAYKKAALNRDYSGLYLMQLAYDFLVPGMFAWGDLFNKGASVDLDTTQDYEQLFRMEKDKIGAPLSLLIWGSVKNWPVHLIDSTYRRVGISNTHTLMIGGNLDISTPPEYASVELLPFLSNGKQVIFKDMAHVDDLMRIQKDAFDHLLCTYFDEGEVDTSLYKFDPVSFKVPISFNSIAKIFYPIISILSIK